MKRKGGGFDIRRFLDAVASRFASAKTSIMNLTDGYIHVRIGVRRLFVAVAAVFVFVLILVLFCKKGADVRTARVKGGSAAEQQQKIVTREAREIFPNKIPVTNVEIPSKEDIQMVRVEGGTFVMGCTAEQQNCMDFESPPHNKTVGDFFIGKYEVTQEQWVRVMGKNPSDFKGKNLPVVRVSWYDVQEFIRKLNSATGKKYRLPTEAEWEYAARGGVKSRRYRYSGSNNLDAVAWYDEDGDIKISKNKDGKTAHPVGTKAPNELGIYDMSGNVTEWVEDRFLFYDGYYGRRPLPEGARTGRSGSWNRDYRYCHVSWRHYYYPNSRYDGLGFRLARDP